MTTQGTRLRNPTHPGGFVKSEIIEALGLSVTNAAQALGVTRAALSAVLNERAHLSPEMALRLEKAFGVSMDTLMRMLSNGAQKGPPMGAEKGPLFHGVRAARRVAFSSRSASPRGEPRPVQLHPEGGLGGG